VSTQSSPTESSVQGRRKFLTTGHSLGGALATMAARYLADKFADARVELITFGSAAGHNDAFAVRAHGGSHPTPSHRGCRCDWPYSHLGSQAPLLDATMRRRAALCCNVAQRVALRRRAR
jgi:hypothetical protein